MKFLLLYGMDWTNSHPTLMLLGAAVCCHLALWVAA